MAIWDWFKSEDQKKADRAKEVERQQKQRLSDVLRQSMATGNPAQKRAAQTYRTNTQRQAAQTIKKPTQSIWDKTTDIFDANSAMDRYKRLQTNQQELYQNQQRAKGVADSSIETNPLSRGLLTAQKMAEGVIEAPVAFGRSTGSYLGMKSGDYNSALKAEDTNRDVITSKNVEMLRLLNDPTVDTATKQRAINFLNNSDGYTSGMDEIRAKIASDTDPRRMAAAGVSLVADLATLGVAGASKAGIKGAYTAAKAGSTAGRLGQVTTGLVAGAKRFGIDTAKTAGLGSIAGGTSAYIQDPNATFKQAVMGAGMGAAGGAALPALMVGASSVVPTTKLASRTASKALKDNYIIPPTRLKPEELADLSIGRQKMGTGQMIPEDEWFNFQRATQKAGIDPNSNKAIDDLLASHRTYDVKKQARAEKIDNFKQGVKDFNKKTQKDQGGFVANPFYNKKTMNDAIDPINYKTADEFIKAHGEPMYHGTMAEFDTFDPNKLGSNTGAKSAKKGFFFTPQKEVAETYVTKGANETGNAFRTQKVIDTEIQKLTGDNQTRAAFKMLQEDMFNRDSGYDIATKKKLNKLLDEYADSVDTVNKYDDEYFMPEDALSGADGSKVIEAYPDLKNPLVHDAKGAKRSPSDYTDLLEKARKDGYDGVVIKNTYDRQHDLLNQDAHDVVVVFDEKSIKTKQQLTDIYNQATKPSLKQAIKSQKGSTLAGGPFGVAKDLADTAKAKKAGLNPKIKEAIKRQRIIDKPEDDISALKMLNAVSEDSINEVNTTKNFTEWRKLKETQAVQDGAIKAELNGRFETIDNLAKEKTGLSLEEIYDTIKTSKSTPKPAPVEKTPTLQDALEGKNTKIKKINDNAQKANLQQTQKLETPQKPKLVVKDVATQQQSGKSLKVRKPQSKTSYSNNTTLGKKAYQDTFGVTEKQAIKDLDKLANEDPLTQAISNKTTKEQAKLIQGMKQDDIITKAAKEAQRTGKEFNFYGKIDRSGRSVGIESFNPKRHRIEAGLVIDDEGKLLGNHIKIDETGTAVNIGGKYTKMEDVFGDITKWKSQNKYTSTLERNIMEAAPDEATGKKVVNWIVGNKTKAERKWKDAIGTAVEKNDARYKSVVKNKPMGVSTKQVLADSMDYGEASLTKADLRAKYGKEYTKTITDAIDGMRADYDRYIKDINDTRLRFGLEPIEPRKDYITHISELNNNKNFVGDLTTALKNSITGEAMERTRGGVPADIAGRTEGFQPNAKWNQFLQRRKGGAYTKDPFKAFNEYVPNAEHNIHMTESITRARAAEEFLRARTNLAGMNEQNYGKLLSSELGQKVKGGPQDDKLVSLFQEYANALAGKTQKLDRAVLDSPLRPGLKGWQGLQRIGGRATILANASSVLMQPLNQVNVFAKVKPKSYAKGLAKWLKNDDAIKQSNFVQARVKHIDSALRGKGQKFLDATGVPLRSVEEQSVKLAWHANYEDALAKGLKGKSAVLEADRLTERAVAGRGLADKPEAYRSTAINGFLQYTLEVMAQAKVFWKDLTPVQKAKWVAGAAAINTGYEIVMNDRPLPDYINAVSEGMGIGDSEDDRNLGEKVVSTGQRALGETAKFNPLVANAAQMLPRDVKIKAFGSDSDLTRFDGTAAPIRVIDNAYRAGKATLQGNAQEAISRGLRLVPTGNQIQKTGNSVIMNQRGYNVDKNGKKTFDAPTTTADKARSLVFGPYATDAAQGYYKEGTGSLAKSKPGEPLTLEQAQANATKRIKTAFGKDYAEMGVRELKELAKTDPTAKQAYDIWNQTTKAFGAGADTPVGLNETAVKVLNRAKRTTNPNWNNIKSTEKEVQDTIQNWVGDKYQLPKITNYVAEQWAKYEQARADGTLNPIEAETKKKSILKSAFKSEFDDTTRSFYSLGDDAMRNELRKGTISKEQMDKVIAIDNALTELGLQKYAQVGKTLRRELGYGLVSSSGGSGRSGSSRSGGSGRSRSLGMDYKLFGFGNPQSTTGALRKLLEQTQA